MFDLINTIQVMNQEIESASSAQYEQFIEINDYLYSYLVIDDEDITVIENLKTSSGKRKLPGEGGVGYSTELGNSPFSL